MSRICARRGRRSSSQGQRVPPTSLLYQDLNLAQRVLRDFVNDETSRIQVDSRETYQMLADFAAEFTPAVSSQAASLHRRAAALRPVQHRGGDSAGVVAARRSEVGRLSDDRPDRSDDDDRRQHRRLRRRAQFRRHDLQDQSRSRAHDRAAIAAAQSGRHHHHRFHRHGERRASRPGARRVEEGAVTRSHARDGEWVLAAGACGDDAQAHA